MGTFGVVELKGAGDGVEDGGGGAAEASSFELGVVLDADAGKRGNLAPAQPGHATGADVGQPGLLRAELGPPGGEELADLGAVVHVPDPTVTGRALGCSAGTPLGRDSFTACGRG
jgi:hypothetical protein